MMVDFLTRLAERTLGQAMLVQPLIAPRFAPGQYGAGTAYAARNEPEQGAGDESVQVPPEGERPIRKRRAVSAPIRQDATGPLKPPELTPSSPPQPRPAKSQAGARRKGKGGQRLESRTDERVDSQAAPSAKPPVQKDNVKPEPARLAHSVSSDRLTRGTESRGGEQGLPMVRKPTPRLVPHENGLIVQRSAGRPTDSAPPGAKQTDLSKQMNPTMTPQDRTAASKISTRDATPAQRGTRKLRPIVTPTDEVSLGRGNKATIPGYEQGRRGPIQARPRAVETVPSPAAIHVTIGRLEVRATPPPRASEPQRPAPSVMSLEDYLSRRSKRDGK